MQAVYMAVQEAEEFVSVMRTKDSAIRTNLQNPNVEISRWQPQDGNGVEINVRGDWQKEASNVGAR